MFGHLTRSAGDIDSPFRCRILYVGQRGDYRTRSSDRRVVDVLQSGRDPFFQIGLTDGGFQIRVTLEGSHHWAPLTSNTLSV
jgi:hypothetical protein